MPFVCTDVSPRNVHRLGDNTSQHELLLLWIHLLVLLIVVSKLRLHGPYSGIINKGDSTFRNQSVACGSCHMKSKANTLNIDESLIAYCSLYLAVGVRIGGSKGSPPAHGSRFLHFHLSFFVNVASGVPSLRGLHPLREILDSPLVHTCK